MRIACCRLLVVIGCLVAVVSSPSSAVADGGPSIAGAPLVAYGQQQFGNTATGGIDRSDACDWIYSSNWLLPVVAGDHITIDWEIQASHTELLLYPLGINDFNVGSTGPLTTSSIDTNGRSEVVYSASASGNLPLVFTGESGGLVCNVGWHDIGPYDFTAYVQHVVRLSLPRLAAVRRRASVAVAVRNAEGGVISDPGLLVDIQIRTRSAWLSVGRAAVSNGQAIVPLNIPLRYLHEILGLRAVAQGGSYLEATTRSQPVLIFQRPKARARPGSRRRRHQTARAVGLLDGARTTAAAVTPWGEEYDPVFLAQQCVGDVFGRLGEVLGIGGGSARNGAFSIHTGWSSDHPAIRIRGRSSISIDATVNPMISGLVSPDGIRLPCPEPAGETIRTRVLYQEVRLVKQQLRHGGVRLRLKKSWAPASPWVTAIADSVIGAPPLPADRANNWQNPGFETLTYALSRPYRCLKPAVRQMLRQELRKQGVLHPRGVGRGIALQLSTSAHSGDESEHETSIDEFFRMAIDSGDFC